MAKPRKKLNRLNVEFKRSKIRKISSVEFWHLKDYVFKRSKVMVIVSFGQFLIRFIMAIKTIMI
jgi:hypothetical protein